MGDFGETSQNTILIECIIESEFNNLKNIIDNKINIIKNVSNYCYYYKQFETNAKIYEKIAHYYKNKKNQDISLPLFKLASMLYHESGVLREQCHLIYYDNNNIIDKDLSHIKAFEDCISKYKRCEINMHKLRTNV